jgi:hypothetical protein
MVPHGPQLPLWCRCYWRETWVLGEFASGIRNGDNPGRADMGVDVTRGPRRLQRFDMY